MLSVALSEKLQSQVNILPFLSLYSQFKLFFVPFCKHYQLNKIIGHEIFKNIIAICSVKNLKDDLIYVLLVEYKVLFLVRSLLP